MPEAKDLMLTIYGLYVATAEKVSDRRATANTSMLSVNTAIVSFYGYLEADKNILMGSARGVWLWAIPGAGVIVCLAWVALLVSYRRLNAAKFSVIVEMEKELGLRPFERERVAYLAIHGRPFSVLETFVPACFILLYVVMPAAAAVVR